jgi:ATP-dependent RNA helicase DDX5/DBP2
MSYGRDYTNGYSNGYSNGSGSYDSRDKTKYDPPLSRAASDSLTRSGSYSNGYSDASYSRGSSTGYSNYRDSNRDSTYESKYDGGRGGYGSSSYGGGFDKFDKMADMGSGLKKQVFDLDKLPKFEKNFYREAPEVSRRSEREINEFRNEKEIRVSGKTIPRPVETFEEAGFPCTSPPFFCTFVL